MWNDAIASTQDYYIEETGEGLVKVHAWTNDNYDQGYPNEDASWDLEFKSLAMALEHTGYTRRGISGVKVNVYLNGVLIGKGGKAING